MRLNRRVFSFGPVALLGSLALLLCACGDTTETPPAPGPLSGLVEVDDFTLGVGESAPVEGDLTIRAQGAITIAGTLFAASETGHSVTLDADGDIIIEGVVAAGGGAAGQPGGAVRIVSRRGDVSLSAGARVVGGDGGDGVMDVLTLGRAGEGGDVALSAPEGALRVAAGARVVLGNGGRGAELRLQPMDLAGVEEVRLPNAGGRSGLPTLEGRELVGIESEEGDWPQDWLELMPAAWEDSEAWLDLAPAWWPEAAGRPYRAILTADVFEGGAGGAAGTVLYGDDAEGESNWPGDGGLHLMTRAPFQGPAPGLVVIRGASGADGFVLGGPGQSLFMAGLNGRTPGEGGQSVVVWGGGGGSCIPGRDGARVAYLATCVAGPAGAAAAYGGTGHRGRHPDGAGGRGGDAQAFGGVGGVGPLRDGRLYHEGACGDATADGGPGGGGGGDCEGVFGPQGGEGGPGGDARAGLDLGVICALGPFGQHREVSRRAESGRGGDGGDGLTPGPVGAPGDASSPLGQAVQGTSGDPGASCVAAPDDASAAIELKGAASREGDAVEVRLVLEAMSRALEELAARVEACPVDDEGALAGTCQTLDVVLPPTGAGGCRGSRDLDHCGERSCPPDQRCHAFAFLGQCDCVVTVERAIALDDVNEAARFVRVELEPAGGRLYVEGVGVIPIEISGVNDPPSVELHDASATWSGSFDDPVRVQLELDVANPGPSPLPAIDYSLCPVDAQDQPVGECESGQILLPETGRGLCDGSPDIDFCSELPCAPHDQCRARVSLGQCRCSRIHLEEVLLEATQWLGRDGFHRLLVDLMTPGGSILSEPVPVPLATPPANAVWSGATVVPVPPGVNDTFVLGPYEARWYYLDVTHPTGAAIDLDVPEGWVRYVYNLFTEEAAAEVGDDPSYGGVVNSFLTCCQDVFGPTAFYVRIMSQEEGASLNFRVEPRD